MDQKISLSQETHTIMKTRLEKESTPDPTDNLLRANDDETIQPSLYDVIPQIIASCIAHCTMIQAGINIGYSSILTDGLEKEGVSKEERSWIASLSTISLPIGALMFGPLMDRYGRKKVCLGSCLPSLVSWAILMKGHSPNEVYFARIIAGFSAGLSTGSLVYISEITHPWIRSVLLSFHSVFASLGILITTCLVSWFDWDDMAFIFFSITLSVFFMLLFVPESPHWLICFSNEELDERKNQVQSVLRRLNKSEKIYNEELCRIYKISENLELNGKTHDSVAEKVYHFLNHFKIPSVYKPTLILFILLIIQQLSGTYAVIFYALDMFNSICNQVDKGVDKYDALLILGIMRFIASLITALISKKFGRRTLGIASGLGMTISMFYLVLYINFKSNEDVNDFVKIFFNPEQKWIPVMALLFYVLASSLGFAMVPWTLIGELLPTSVRGTMGGVMISHAHIFMFGMVKGYHSMVEKIDVQGVFCFYGFVALLGCIFIYSFVPETLGKSFIEIERHFNKNEMSDHSFSKEKHNKSAA
ncbi:hypothetical protein QAD02_016143 [Eretmocerus hayati]|uniref:Uncharacterized protein n=1 Tax=Eretmocerus hayati TaxID=131215 RepID=A0ACC2PBJ6_9HYME|nr:hypothetical protein QAD02_016143 [Eretmocerus hayati]